MDGNTCKYIRLSYNKQKKPLGFRFNWNPRGFIGFGKDQLIKKETVFRLSLWCARRDLNSRFVEYMEFLKLLFTQNARFVSNIPIFPTGFFTLILLRVLVRVKIRVNTIPVHQQIVVVAVLEFYSLKRMRGCFRVLLILLCYKQPLFQNITLAQFPARETLL